MDISSEIYTRGYIDGMNKVLNRVAKYLDEDTIASLREEFLGEES